jgi:hypothetical protein
MQKDENRIRIELTDEQKQQVKLAGGKEVTALEFTVTELEERIAPASDIFAKLGGIKGE